MRLRLSPEAKEDIYRIHEFGSTRYGVPHADAYVDELLEALRKVEQYPFASRERTETQPPVRVRPCGAHNICYREADGTLWVIRILHHAVDWMTEL